MSGLVRVIYHYKSLKMVTPLVNCSLVEQRSVIHIFMVRMFKIIWNQRLATSARVFWPSGFFCSMMIHVCIPRHLLLKKIKQLKFRIFPHLPCRPDLAPSDYHKQKKPFMDHHWRRQGRSAYMALITTDNLIDRWVQKACALLNNIYKKGTIMLRNDTHCIYYRLLYM